MLDSPVMKMFRQSLFARVVPNIKKLGLLSRACAPASSSSQILQFEDFDAEAADRRDRVELNKPSTAEERGDAETVLHFSVLSAPYAGEN